MPFTPNELLQLRLTVLQMANLNASSEIGEAIVSKAQTFLNFLLPAEEMKAESAPAAAPKKPKGKKAAEVIGEVEEATQVVVVVDTVAGETTTEAAAEETEVEETTEAAPAIEYKEVQTAVMDLLKAGKKTEVLAIFDQFGVATALDLKPEQYAEALEALKGA